MYIKQHPLGQVYLFYETFSTSNRLIYISCSLKTSSKKSFKILYIYKLKKFLIKYYKI